LIYDKGCPHLSHLEVCSEDKTVLFVTPSCLLIPNHSPGDGGSPQANGLQDTDPLARGPLNRDFFFFKVINLVILDLSLTASPPPLRARSNYGRNVWYLFALTATPCPFSPPPVSTTFFPPPFWRPLSWNYTRLYPSLPSWPPLLCYLTSSCRLIRVFSAYPCSHENDFPPFFKVTSRWLLELHRGYFGYLSNPCVVFAVGHRSRLFIWFQQISLTQQTLNYQLPSMRFLKTPGLIPGLEMGFYR